LPNSVNILVYHVVSYLLFYVKLTFVESNLVRYHSHITLSVM